MYLHVKVLFDLDGVAKQADVLGQIGKLPHVAQALQGARLLAIRLDVHFVGGAFSRRHGCGASRAATRATGERVGGAGRRRAGGRDGW